MKKKIFSILAIAAVAFTSCKKDDPNSSELGEATINGSIWGELDLTNTMPEGIEGMQVTVIVNTENWDQDPDGSYNYDERVYTTTVAADGSYSLTIPATEKSYDVDIMFADLITTRTLADGETENVRVTNGDETVTLYAGAMVAVDNQASITSLGSNESDTYGSATVYGQVWAPMDVGFTPEGVEEWTGGGTIVWRYEDAPYTSSEEDIYSVTINADGTYSITFATEELSGSSVGLDWGIMDFEGTQIQNNAAGTADSTVSGIWTVGGIEYYDGEYFTDGELSTGWDITLSFNAY